MSISELLQRAVAEQASDIFILSGAELAFKIGSRGTPVDSRRLIPAETAQLVQYINHLAGERAMETLLATGDDDFSFSVAGLGRFRCNAYKQRGSLSAVLRVVAFGLPDYRQLGIPETVIGLSEKRKGLVLITGSAGSGKSTTMACIVDRINQTRTGHIITIEDPIEYLHPHRKCLISQREVDNDTTGYQNALRAALRQAPDVILLGEMRDYETISTAMTAAETGQLVLSSLHTVGAANTIDRIVDVFPPGQQQQIRVQLSMVLEAVVSQQLLPAVDGSLVPAFEIMLANSAVRNMIREAKVHQIDNVIYASASLGMTAMDTDILRLYSKKQITAETALRYAANPDLLGKKL